MEINVRQEKPHSFEPTAHVVGAFILCHSKVLLLQRGEVQMHPNKWGLPAGKLEEGETVDSALEREVKEESGIVLPISAYQDLTTFYVTNPRTPFYNDFVFDTFFTQMESKPLIVLAPDEHQSFAWVDLDKVAEYDLIDGALEVFNQTLPKIKTLLEKHS